MKTPKRIIGRSDVADFPDLNLLAVPVKVDTGAYTSALHTHDVREERLPDGTTRVVFRLLDPAHPLYSDVDYFTADYERTTVRSSNGVAEERFVIRTAIVLFGRAHRIRLSLSARGEMRFPVLLGRKFLKGRFVVDPSATDLSYAARTDAI